MAEEFLSPIDMLLDENNTENIKLYNEENQEVEFEQIALIPIEDKTYAILYVVMSFIFFTISHCFISNNHINWISK